MDRITTHNYEAFVLDYLEGKLGEDLVNELRVFALRHPELLIDLDDTLPYIEPADTSADFKLTLKKGVDALPDDELLEYMEGLMDANKRLRFETQLMSDPMLAESLTQYKNTLLTPEAAEQFAKHQLMKNDDDFILNNQVIAYVEGQLKGDDLVVFEQEMRANEQLKRETTLFLQTKLPLPDIYYPDRDSLKKETRVILLFNWRVVASVAAAILLLIGLFVVVSPDRLDPGIQPNGVASAEPIVKNGDGGGENNQTAVTEVNKENKKGTSDSRIAAPQTALTLMPKQKKNVLSLVAAKQLDTNHEPAAVTDPSIAAMPMAQATPSAVQTSTDETHQGVQPVTPGASAEPALLAMVEPSVNKPAYVVAVEEASDDTEFMVAEGKPGFWKKAVKIAKQANRLGVKSVDGEENSRQSFRISINAFSVEKK